MNKNLSIGIVGLGAIGTTVSFALNKNHAIRYFNRSSKHSIDLQSESGLQSRNITLSEYDDNKLFDWLIICLKEYQVAAALPNIQKLIHPDLCIVVIQNGLRIKDPFINLLPSDRIIECIIDCPTEKLDAGHYFQRSPPQILIDSKNDHYTFHDLFNSDQATVLISNEFHKAKWSKLIESSALGGILCMTGESCWIFEDEKMVTLYKSVIQEGIDVAVADGAILDKGFMETLVQKLKQYPKSKLSSMLIDKRNGNPIELNAKNGIISQLGKEYKIATPINDLICLFLKHTNKELRSD